MFESTTHFDFDDDAISDTSFAPTVNSTQASQGTKRVSEQPVEGDSKKPKCEGTIVALNKSPTKHVPVQAKIHGDRFSSPSRVVRRKFPGPAGLLPEIGASDKSILQLLENEKLRNEDVDDMPILSQQTNLAFENGPWKEMRRDFRGGCEEDLVNRFNIRWIKRQASRQLLSHKAPFLAAVIQNLDVVDGRVPTINVTLRDSTGDIRGTILHSLYEQHSDQFRMGSVLVLKQFGVLSAGHNNHCVTITPNNLISIYCPEASRRLPGENTGNICGEGGTGDTVRKIIINSYDAGEILKRYDEDVLVYSREKREEINFGNLYRKGSGDEATTGFGCRSDKSLTANRLLLDKPQSTVCSSGSNPVPEASNSASGVALPRDSPAKKRFTYKKQPDVGDGPRTVANEYETDRRDKTADDVVVTRNQMSVKPDRKEHAEIWKNLLEDVDTDSLFDNF